ncbi:MAG: lactate utilization protein [Patescibacteria group bacterium]|jgi:L-lactate utilization protein LutC
MNYETLATPESIQKATAALTEHGFEVMTVNTKEEALEKVKSLIPPGGSVTTGSSRTLEEIGFVDYLKAGQHGWNNLKEAIVNEKDPAKQAELRNQSVHAEYFLVSAHAVTETGQIIQASNSGSQIPSVAFTSKNVIFIVGAHKIVPTLEEGLKRVREYVFPLEDQRMKSTGAPGSAISKILISEREAAFMQRKVRVIFVNEKLGF